MFWFFEREGAHLHFELRKDDDGRAFELVVTHPDGSQEVERFEETRGLVRRSCALRTELIDEGWEVIGDV